MSERKYLPTLSDLVDRLSICQLKAIFIPEHAAEYRGEIALIMHDIDVAIEELKERDGGFSLGAQAIHAAQVIAIANRVIWEYESLARAGGSAQDKLLKFTHSINGVRNTAKNVLSAATGERRDWKIDCFAAEFVQQFGDWNIFNAANDG